MAQKAVAVGAHRLQEAYFDQVCYGFQVARGVELAQMAL
jgi:hypothetical protein